MDKLDQAANAIADARGIPATERTYGMMAVFRADADAVISALPTAAPAETEAAFLVALAEHGVPADVAELLVQGNPRLGCPPGALGKALAAACGERRG